MVGVVDSEVEEEEEMGVEADLVMVEVVDSVAEEEEKEAEGVGCSCIDSQHPSMYKIEIRTHRTCWVNTAKQKYMFPYQTYLRRST